MAVTARKRRIAQFPRGRFRPRSEHELRPKELPESSRRKPLAGQGAGGGGGVASARPVSIGMETETRSPPRSRRRSCDEEGTPQKRRTTPMQFMLTFTIARGPRCGYFPLQDNGRPTATRG